MTPSTETSNPKPSATDRQAMAKEIQAKWDKFSEKDVSDLKTRDDLVTQVGSKYGIEKGQAQRDVDALLNGRQF